jgi:hypothetical protein
MKTLRTTIIFIVLIGVVLMAPAFSMAQQLSVAERVAALKANVVSSQAKLRQYQWIQNTVVSVNGEVKYRNQERCYYGADGNIAKVILNQTAPPPDRRGLIGRIEDKKREEMTDYMKSAVSLIRQYVPPDPAKLQAAKDSGNVSIQLLEPGKLACLTFSNYLKSGDSLALNIDLVFNTPVAATVNTSDSENNPVTLSVNFAALNDGTTYPASAVLNAPNKGLSVSLQDSGYLKMGQ